MPSSKKTAPQSSGVVKMRTHASANEITTNYETFMSHLKEDLPPIINERFYQMYTVAWQYVQKQDGEAHERESLLAFQTLLGEVPNWDDERITEETEYMLGEMPFLRECLRHMLIARVSILMRVRNNEMTQGNFEFVMPSDEEIVHNFYSRAARRLRGSAALYSHTVPEITREENTLRTEDIIRKSVEKSIPALVPLKDVVQSHLIEESSDKVYEQEQNQQPPSASSSSESESESHNEDEELPQEDDDGESQEEENLNLGPDETAAAKPPLAEEDVPADRSAAQTAVMEGDSDKTVHLKETASELQRLVEKLERKITRVPRKQKSVHAALQEEIDARRAQLKRVKKKIKRVDE